MSEITWRRSEKKKQVFCSICVWLLGWQCIMEHWMIRVQHWELRSSSEIPKRELFQRTKATIHRKWASWKRPSQKADSSIRSTRRVLNWQRKLLNITKVGGFKQVEEIYFFFYQSLICSHLMACRDYSTGFPCCCWSLTCGEGISATNSVCKCIFSFHFFPLSQQQANWFVSTQQGRSKLYVPNNTVFSQVEGYIRSSSNSPFSVSGISGSGKTSLLGTKEIHVSLSISFLLVCWSSWKPIGCCNIWQSISGFLSLWAALLYPLPTSKSWNTSSISSTINSTFK